MGISKWFSGISDPRGHPGVVFFSASREYYKYCMLIKVHNYVCVFCSHNLQNKPQKNSKEGDGGPNSPQHQTQNNFFYMYIRENDCLFFLFCFSAENGLLLCFLFSSGQSRIFVLQVRYQDLFSQVSQSACWNRFWIWILHPKKVHVHVLNK